MEIQFENGRQVAAMGAACVVGFSLGNCSTSIIFAHVPPRRGEQIGARQDLEERFLIWEGYSGFLRVPFLWGVVCSLFTLEFF